MTVGRLEREMSSRELTQWMALYALEAEERAEAERDAERDAELERSAVSNLQARQQGH